MSHIKLCPKCKREMKYKQLSHLTRSKRENRTCKWCKCTTSNKKKCLKCSQLLDKRTISLLCRKCKPKKIYTRVCPRCDNTLTYSNAPNFCRAKKENSTCKHCNKPAKWLLGKIIVPNFNISACVLFDIINKEMNWNGRHALNEGEFFIKPLGYWVDFYEPIHNIVIEYDEPYHKFVKNDNFRQQEICKFLNCRFFRISAQNSNRWREIIICP
jgi:hypothetical protein